ncbi:MAG: cupin domain-containing protein [Cyclobacteriaceae bacterium]|nr:cupin domain-containing protein [Cyclobacteriaceae bacterium]
MKTKLFIIITATGLFGLGYLFGTTNTDNGQVLRANGKSNAENIGDIDQYVRHFDGTNGSPTKKGFQYWYVPTEMSHGLMNLKMSQVKAMDANHAPHKHEAEEIIMLLEGSAEFKLGDQVKQVEANSTLYCPSGIMHGIRNTGQTPIKYLIIKNK